MTEKPKIQNTKKGCNLLIFLALGGLLLLYFTCNGEPDKPLTKEEQRTQKINDLLYSNGFNSVNIKLDTYIKQSLNDPNSYEQLGMTYIDRDSILIVTKEFTAKNGFGGRVRGEVVVACDTLGNIIEIIKGIE